MNDRDPDPPVDPEVSPFDVATPVAAERTWDLLLAIAAGGRSGCRPLLAGARRRRTTCSRGRRSWRMSSAVSCSVP